MSDKIELLFDVQRLEAEKKVLIEALKMADEVICEATWSSTSDKQRDLNWASDKIRRVLAVEVKE